MDYRRLPHFKIGHGYAKPKLTNWFINQQPVYKPFKLTIGAQLVHNIYMYYYCQQSIYAMSLGQHHWGTHSQSRGCSVEERKEKSVSSFSHSLQSYVHNYFCMTGMPSLVFPPKYLVILQAMNS